MNEQELRDLKAPWPESVEELTEFIESLVNQEHDYGTCVYAMSLSAVAAFQYVASKLGCSGFQASCADMDILRRTRRMERFIILDASNALYPQYNLQEKLTEYLAELKPWLKEEAAKKLAENDGRDIHPDVRRHWEGLAS